VYLTLLTIENVFSRDWKTPGREKLPITLRLRPIINHFGPNGNHVGSWYHLFGIMLYGYSENAVKAWFMGHTESLGRHILDHFRDETQEDDMNSTGGRIGAGLYKGLRRRNYLAVRLVPSHLEEPYYLNLTENFFKRLRSRLNGLFKKSLRGTD
jgi:hypothetical protein